MAVKAYSYFPHRVGIQRKTTSKDAYGAPQPGGWSTLLESFASVRAASGREAYVDGPNGVVALATHVVTMRWPGLDVLPTDRIVFKSRVFEITRVDDIEEANRFLEITATELRG